MYGPYTGTCGQVFENSPTSPSREDRTEREVSRRTSEPVTTDAVGVEDRFRVGVSPGDPPVHVFFTL